MQAESTISDQLRYVERLALAWFVMWRLAVIGFLAGLVFGVISVAMRGTPVSVGPLLQVVVIPLVLLYIFPVLIFPKLFRKRFKGFRLDIVRP